MNALNELHDASVPWQAKWITAPAAPGAGPMPLMRMSCALDESPRRASLMICALGHGEVRVNGQPVSDHLLSPAWSDYRKTCYFTSHDVLTHLEPGENVIAVMLGNGFFNVCGSRYRKFKGSFGPPMLIAQLTIESESGAISVIGSDAHWRAAPGPITHSCIYGGEDYDARLLPIGWDMRGFDDANWSPAIVCDGPGGVLVEMTSPPIRVHETLSPVKTTPIEPDRVLLDFGQNAAAIPMVSIDGAVGASVTIHPAELLDANGRITQKHTGSPVSFSYTKATSDRETWQPRFSYTGFRYAEVVVSDPSTRAEVQSGVLHASAERVGRFECSDESLNRIDQLIDAAVRSNMQHVLTDCPHREKLGWLEQAHLMGSAVFNAYDVAPVYRKICRDMRDAQRDDGCVPTIAPQYTSFKPPWDIFNDSPEWGLAMIFCPWLVYQRTGDRSVLVENYDAMRRYAAYLGSRTQSGILSYGLGDWYDVVPGEKPGFSKLTSLGLTATALYVAGLHSLRQAAEALGRTEDAAGFAEQGYAMREAFNTRFYDALNRRYDTASQTACAMPVALGLADETQRAAAVSQLVKDIESRDYAVTAGDIGFRFVLEGLASAGRSDVIYRMLKRHASPSYLAQVAAGATSLSEAWDANPTSSQNHMMLGHAQIWLFQWLAGLDVDFSRTVPEQIVFRPTPVGDVSWASASLRTPVGRASIRWERTPTRLRVVVRVPAGARATLLLPTTDGRETHELDSGTHTLETRAI